MTRFLSWVFLILAVVHLVFVHVRFLPIMELNCAIDRNMLLAGLVCAVIAGVLRMP